MAAVAVVIVAAMAAPVAAAPTEPASGASPDRPAGWLVDRNGDRVDDGLRAALDRARPSDLLDVVATFGSPSSAAAARASLPPAALRARFRLIDGFAATVTAARAEALA